LRALTLFAVFLTVTGILIALYRLDHKLPVGTALPETNGTVLVARSGKMYEIAPNIDSGKVVYTDRSYVYSAVPEILRGMTYIRTANDDKNSDARTGFLTFHLVHNVPLYVIYDNRLGRGRPTWLTGFRKNPLLRVTTTDKDARFEVFEADTMHDVSLGGNMVARDPGDAVSMYTVVLGIAQTEFREEIAKSFDEQSVTGSDNLDPTVWLGVRNPRGNLVPHLTDAWLLERIVEHGHWLRNRPGRRLDMSDSLLPARFLDNVDISHADFIHASLDSATITRSKLAFTELQEAALSHASLIRCDLSHANLSSANLTGTKLNGSNLSGANLKGTRLAGADFSATNLSGAIFEADTLPDARLISQADSLSFLTYSSYPGALLELREAFKDGGYKDQCDQITAALQRKATSSVGPVEQQFRKLAFEYTCEYGLAPTRPALAHPLVHRFFLPHLPNNRRAQPDFRSRGGYGRIAIGGAAITSNHSGASFGGCCSSAYSLPFSSGGKKSIWRVGLSGFRPTNTHSKHGVSSGRSPDFNRYSVLVWWYCLSFFTSRIHSNRSLCSEKLSFGVGISYRIEFS